MMQTCASTAKLRGGGPFLTIGWKAMELSGITATSDRFRQSVPLCRNLLLFDGFDAHPESGRYATQLEVSGYGAGRDDAPEHNQ